MALTGQAATHMPQPLQALLSTTVAIFCIGNLLKHEREKVKINSNRRRIFA
jgi:hypothetical protein